MRVQAADSSEKDLMELKRGCDIAFAKIYNLYAPRLYNNLLYLVKDEDVAKEMLQDVFLKVWNQRALIDPDKSFKSFLYKIGENLVYDYFRKAARDKKIATLFIQNACAHYTHIEEVLFHKETEWILRSAIDSLSPQRKQVYTLCKLEGKSYKEVSETLGISVSTISDHIVKATRSIKEYFNYNHHTAVSVAVAAALFGFLGSA